MEFRWSMDNDDFKRMQHNMRLGKWASDNCYGGIAVGSLLWEFTTDVSSEKETKLLVQVYAAGTKFAGYGTLKDGTPYDHIDCYWGKQLGLIITGSFEDFKDSVQHAIMTLSADDKHIKEMIESNLKPMWYGFDPELKEKGSVT